MLIRLFQQAPISSIRACRAPRFRKPCPSSEGRELLQAYLDEIDFRHSRRKLASMTMLSSPCISPSKDIAWAHEAHTLECQTLERKRDAIS